MVELRKLRKPRAACAILYTLDVPGRFDRLRGPGCSDAGARKAQRDQLKKGLSRIVDRLLPRKPDARSPRKRVKADSGQT